MDRQQWHSLLFTIFRIDRPRTTINLATNRHLMNDESTRMITWYYLERTAIRQCIRQWKRRIKFNNSVERNICRHSVVDMHNHTHTIHMSVSFLYMYVQSIYKQLIRLWVFLLIRSILFKCIVIFKRKTITFLYVFRFSLLSVNFGGIYGTGFMSPFPCQWISYS